MTYKEKITDGPNGRAIDEPVAGMAPGISDEAAAPGGDLPTVPSDDEVGRVARQIGAPVSEADRN